MTKVFKRNLGATYSDKSCCGVWLLHFNCPQLFVAGSWGQLKCKILTHHPRFPFYGIPKESNNNASTIIGQTSVACAVAQVLPRPQLIFPSKTWFLGIYLNFQRQKSLKN
jgi:hypothetical protein